VFRDYQFEEDEVCASEYAHRLKRQDTSAEAAASTWCIVAGGAAKDKSCRLEAEVAGTVPIGTARCRSKGPTPPAKVVEKRRRDGKWQWSANLLPTRGQQLAEIAHFVKVSIFRCRLQFFVV
jgi:hypothetical protein